MTTNVQALLPKRIKTADGLLATIERLILEEPLRYNQWDVLTVKWHPMLGDPHVAFPDCGTVGCVGGWTVALTRRRQQYGSLLSNAARVLGLTGDQAGELFGAEKAGQGSQTLDHARRGAAHIRRFRKKYRAQLRAKRIRRG